MRSPRTQRAIATSVEVAIYVVLACAAVVAVGSGVSGTINGWSAQHDGEVGTFTPVEQSCDRSRSAVVCTWTGTWASDTGERTIEGVLLDEDLGTAEGDPPPGPVHPTLHHDAFSDPQVVYRPGDRSWLLSPVIAVALLGMVGVAAWRTRRWSRRVASGAGREARHRRTP
ncbi:hypothetical protein NSA53_08105 [Cellulosimicrobium cellulans]|uniref:hypothetical protein n=1 Tax=Cellulosimicrobium cellulans TaxID=1710 RepID=UPI002149C1AC|nr:hypothetical protein [Cellulosimicrobium cellulans]